LLSREQQSETRKNMNNIFYIIGVVVVVLVILGYFGLR
jgi:predicted nucleic acid-binding Zn ribbon protein